ncbi:alpha/beta fold hydrolase [Actinomadura madurae]|uniref:alpha/beta fold hydrolase n=1 Tax=Actinomadura madurae TaxID=1993 RepID=UPI0035587EA0
MVQGTVTSADGTTIAYTAWGDGDPIVLIDGATAYRATTPENAQTAELLAGEFQVINYDRRGRGESGDTAPYAVEREFEDLAAIIEQAGGGRPATVFGWSSGGLLALNAVQAGRPGRAPGAVRAAGHRRRQRPAAARRLRRAARRGRGRGPSGGRRGPVHDRRRGHARGRRRRDARERVLAGPGGDRADDRLRRPERRGHHVRQAAPRRPVVRRPRPGARALRPRHLAAPRRRREGRRRPPADRHADGGPWREPRHDRRRPRPRPARIHPRSLTWERSW